MTTTRHTATAITDDQLDALYADLERARRAIRRLLHTTANVGETEDQHVDRISPDAVHGLLDAVADALPVDPAEERDVVWSHYRRTHRVLGRRLTAAETRAERLEQQLDQVRRVARNYPGLRQLHAALDGAQQPDRDCPACEAGIDHTEHCPTPETHNWGCGCPTDNGTAPPTGEGAR